MLQKFIVTLTILAAVSCSNSHLLAAQSNNIEIQQLADLGIQPRDLKTYLQTNAPELVQFLSSTPTKLEAQLYGTIAQSKTPVLVKFYLQECGPCKQMKTVVDNAAKQFSNNLTVINIELTDNTRYLMQAFNARGVPTLVFFKDGKKVEQFTGTLTQAELTAKIKKLVN